MPSGGESLYLFSALYKSKLYFRNKTQVHWLCYWSVTFFLLGKGLSRSPMLAILNRDEWDLHRMPADFARRGRPKGSGLDDRISLRAISDMLEADPTLRPTTAIKRIGVTDPSTIRRLRDKLRQGDGDNPYAGNTGSEAPLGDAIRPHSTQLSAAPGASTPARAERSRRQASYGPVHMMVWQETNTAVSWFTVWCALGLRAFSATVEAQLAAVEGILLAPDGRQRLSAQESYFESRFALSSADPEIRNTVH